MSGVEARGSGCRRGREVKRVAQGRERVATMLLSAAVRHRTARISRATRPPRARVRRLVSEVGRFLFEFGLERRRRSPWCARRVRRRYPATKKERPPNDPRRIGSSADSCAGDAKRECVRRTLYSCYGVWRGSPPSADDVRVIRGCKSELRARRSKRAGVTPRRARSASAARARFARASRSGSRACLSRHARASA
jgi:hypothetical protein